MALNTAQSWLATNQTAEKWEYEETLRELETNVAPLLEQLKGAGGGGGEGWGGVQWSGVW